MDPTQQTLLEQLRAVTGNARDVGTTRTWSLVTLQSSGRDRDYVWLFYYNVVSSVIQEAPGLWDL